MICFEPQQFQLQLSFDFPNSAPTCPGNISVFLFGCLSLLPPPYSSFLHLKSVRSSSFSQAGLLLYLLSTLNIRMDCSCALRRLSLKIKQLSWVSALQGRLPGDSAYQFLEEAKVRTLEILSGYYITCLSHFPQVLKQPSHDTAAKSPQNCSSLSVSSRSSTALQSVSSSSTSVKKLSLMYSVNLLNCLCPITLPFQQMSGGLQFSWQGLC